RRVARRASSAVRALSCAARSSAREVRWPRTPRVHCQETWTSAACRPCPTSLAAVIVVVAKTVSKEFGSDLRRLSVGDRAQLPPRFGPGEFRLLDSHGCAVSRVSTHDCDPTNLVDFSRTAARRVRSEIRLRQLPSRSGQLAESDVFRLFDRRR